MLCSQRFPGNCRVKDSSSLTISGKLSLSWYLISSKEDLLMLTNWSWLRRIFPLQLEIHIIKIVQQTLGKTLNIGKQLTFILPFQYFCDMMHDCCKHETSSCQPRRASRVNSKIWEGGLPSILVASSLLRQRWIHRSDNFEIARERKRQGSENCPLNNWYVTFRWRPPCWMMAFFNGHTRREVHKKKKRKSWKVKRRWWW